MSRGTKATIRARLVGYDIVYVHVARSLFSNTLETLGRGRPPAPEETRRVAETQVLDDEEHGSRSILVNSKGQQICIMSVRDDYREEIDWVGALEK